MNWCIAFYFAGILVGLVIVLPVVVFLVVKFGATAFYLAKRHYEKMKKQEKENNE